MKIAFAASEATPYAKTGGLADVVGALPAALENLGHTVDVFMPRYKGIKGSLKEKIEVKMVDDYDVNVYKEGNYYFLDYPEFFHRDGLYGTEKGDFPDNCERFTLFCKAVAQLIRRGSYDVVHCHDWQTALIPLYLKINKDKANSVLTIHNLGYQGRFPAAKYPVLGIDDDYFTPEGIEYYGDINFLKAGILYSDMVTTVSENYAQEIQTPELGFGLDGVLRTRASNLMGIINGIDYGQWNPQTDELIYHRYSDHRGKQKNKQALINECCLKDKRALIGIVSRVAEQKGFDILVKVFDALIGLGFNIIILGFGDEIYHKKLTTFANVYPQRVSVNIKFDNRFAHRIYASSDFFLMPSKYEPCGLGQLISLRYGTIPIVRQTGGLADTITDYDPTSVEGNGFVFTEYSGEHLLAALSRSMMVYNNQEAFKELSQKCMTYDFSWGKSAKKYIHLYDKIRKTGGNK
ncbi:MAG: glycogen synthase GlgA [bacterium]